MIDDIDRKILSLLQVNSRSSNAELARNVGLTVSSVHERVKKLEHKGVITGYTITVNPELLGKPLLAFIRLTVEVDLEKDMAGLRRKFSDVCVEEPDILECHHVAGEDCYVLKVRATGPKQLEELLNMVRRETRSIRSVTSIVLSTRKESSVVEPAREQEDGAGKGAKG
jgi:Lrp/AsnC family leucine-responsive transcriptional regulator